MEIEAKFCVPDDPTYESLLGAQILAGYRLEDGSERTLADTYLDTADRRVAAAGYTVRQRVWETAVAVTLKQVAEAEGPDATMRREELEITLGLDEAVETEVVGGILRAAALPPGPLRQRVLAMVGDADLEQVLSLEQRRVARDLWDDRRHIAEVSLDKVEVAGGGRRQGYRELEVELRDGGTENDLELLAACLRQDWGLAPETRSKFARALEVVAGEAYAQTPGEAQGEPPAGEPAFEEGAGESAAEEQGGEEAGEAGRPAEDEKAGLAALRADVAAGRKGPGIEPDDLMSEAARKTLLYQLEKMLAHEEGTRLGEDYEELHDMRVASRRMRAALAVFGPYVDLKAYKPYLKALRRTGRTLGSVRDLDVFHEKAERYLEQEVAEDRRSELDILFEAWAQERERRRETMIEWLESSSYRKFVEQFEEFLSRPGAGALGELDEDGVPVARTVTQALPVIIWRELGTVLAFEPWVEGTQVPLPRLHRLRIAGKYLRYSLEFFAEVLGPPSKPYVQRIKDLQDHLGDLQDDVVASGIIRDFLSGHGWGSRDGKRREEPLIMAPGVTGYLAYKQRELATLVETFPEAWEPIREPAYRRGLIEVMAHL